MVAPHSALLSAEQMARALDDLARSIRGGQRPGLALALVGVRTRGVPLAARLARRLAEKHSVEAPVGAVDIALYRDDVGQIAHAPVLHGTDVSFSVDGREIVLVDDVLFTGRTVRAAMDAICDLGRPAAIRLAVLVDRGHRELPIQPDYCAARLDTAAGDRILVRVREVDGVDEVRKETRGDEGDRR